MADPTPFAWTGPCDVVVRRHPKGGYLFHFTGSEHATMARGIHAFALHSASKVEAPSKQAPTSGEGDASYFADPPLDREAASRAVEAMRGLNVLVDDKVLKVDQRMGQWGAVLPSVIVFGGLAAAFFTEGSLWTLLSIVLIFLTGALVGGWVRHQHEQDGTFLRPPWVVAGGAALVVAALIGSFAYFGGMVWAAKNFGGWGFALFTAASVVLLLVGIGLVVMLIDRFRPSTPKKASPSRSAEAGTSHGEADP